MDLNPSTVRTISWYAQSVETNSPYLTVPQQHPQLRREPKGSGFGDPMRTSKLRTVILLAVILCLSFASVDVGAVAKQKKKKQAPRGTPVLWQRPSDISSRDLFLGPGGASMRPDLRRITFIKEEKGGYSKKYRVRDGSGREWVVKIGKEAQSETSAVRLLYGLGYATEINYLVPRVTIPRKGTFTNVRFEARPDNLKRAGEWKWKKNPFVGTPQLQGLK